MFHLNKQRKQRLYYILILLAGIGIALGLILYSLKQNINLFFTPSQALEAKVAPDRQFRLGGQVKPGSVVREGGLGVRFVLTDLKKEIVVRYTGILPDLFKDGNGAIAEGHWGDGGEFVAVGILAKHDESYMPKAMYEGMRKGEGKG